MSRLQRVQSVSLDRWERFTKMQRSGKMNMMSYDPFICMNYDDIERHFDQEERAEDWSNEEAQKG